MSPFANHSFPGSSWERGRIAGSAGGVRGKASRKSARTRRSLVTRSARFSTRQSIHSVSVSAHATEVDAYFATTALREPASGMFYPSATKFFLYGLAIVGLEEFITQGVLKGSYVLWVFTLIPFAVFLGIAGCVRAVLHRFVAGWRAATLYYLITGGIGLAVEWFVIGLSPWSDQTSPQTLVAIFHAGMFSFWATVATAPHILVDPSPEVSLIQHRLRRSFALLMGATYVLTLTAKAAGLPHDVQFLASVGPVVLTFLSINVFYFQYFALRPIQAAHTFQCPSGTVFHHSELGR